MLAALTLLGCSAQPARETDPLTAEKATASAPREKLPRAYDKALVLMQSGDYSAALPVLREFIGKHPDHAGPYINLGIALQHSGDLEGARNALEQAVTLNPDSAPAHHQLGIVYRNTGDFAKALASYQNALRLNPDYALAHRNIGILYDLYLQQAALALSHYRRYLELAGQEDKTVNRWVVDLERRSGSAQASAAP